MGYTDNDLETMKPSELVRLMVAHAEMFDLRVQLHPDTFGWNMDAWLSHDGIDPAHSALWPDCVACLAGAMLHARGERLKNIKDWMHRVNDLRVGCMWTVAATGDNPHPLSGQQMTDLRFWFLRRRPDVSAAHGHAWNSEEDGKFYSAFADKLESLGL